MLGFWELLLVLAIAVLFFGSSKLPALGKALGGTVRSFRKALGESKGEPAQPGEGGQATGAAPGPEGKGRNR